MQTEAVFEHIAERIQQEIAKAQRSIFIAVAWFTNKNLFEELVKKAIDGCSVSLIVSNDNINQNSAIDFNRLKTKTSNVYFIGNGDTELMHNKFCVIDYSTIITGSYNWSYKAEVNFENIIVTESDTVLAEQFITEFNNIRKRYYPDIEVLKEEIVFPLNKIIKRLEILKNYILLEDFDELNKETGKLKVYDFNTDLLEINEAVHNKEYGKAVNKIQNFINRYQQLALWTDSEIIALKLELKLLENQLSAFDNEKIELEKLLSSFHHRHTIELGEIILKILRLRKIKFKDDEEKFEKAEQDEKEYKEQVETEKEKKVYKVSEDQKAEIKNLFRKAVMLCHPDKFSNEPIEVQKLAEEIFKELNEANEKNDLKRIKEILHNLENGILSLSIGNKIDDKEILKATIIRLKEKVLTIENQIIEIKESVTFRLINKITDWDEYFRDTKEKLENELEKLNESIQLESL